MAKDTLSSAKMKNDESNGSKGRQICTRSSASSGSTTQETSGLRRSARETPSKKPSTSASSSRKSGRLEKRAPTPPPVTRKSERIEKKNAPSPLRRSDRGKNISSPNSTGSKKSSRNSGTSSDIEQRRDRKEKNVEELTKDTEKHKTRMTGRAYRELFIRKPKKSEALANQQKNKDSDVNQVDDTECSRNGAKVLGETVAELAHQDSAERAVSCSGHSIEQNDHVEEVNASANAEELAVASTSSMIREDNADAGKVDAECPQTENSELVKLVNSETSRENDTDSPSKRKRSAAEAALDTPATVSNTGGCIMSPECKSDDHPETCSTSVKRQRVDHDSIKLGDCSCSAKPDQESDCTALQDRGKTEAAVNMGFRENNDQNMQQDVSHGCKSDSSRFVEYWVPVLISNIQLEQYCLTLLSKSLPLCSLSKNDPVGALHDILVSVRKTCNHPYAVDESLQAVLFEKFKEVGYLDVDIKASGKLQLLDAMLTEIRKKGSKAVVFYQTTGGTGRFLIGSILEDFVCQRFGPNSYERVERDILSTKKQSALNKFKKESERFVLLLETRACNPSIKLSSVEAFILFDSSWTPLNDLRALQKTKAESHSERTKIFRLYSPCTVEEKVLILARQNKTVDGRENLNLPTTHAMLMWGASYLFDKLDQFHRDPAPCSGASFEQSITADVIQEFSSILSSKGGGKDKGKQSLILEAKHVQGIYRTDSPLFGEEKVKLSDDDKPNIFWTKLLEGKSPMWKYCSVPSQRNRKRVPYSEDSEKGPEVDNNGVTKKRKKAASDSADPSACRDEKKACRKDQEGALEYPSFSVMQPSPRSTSGRSYGNDALAGHISEIPGDMLVGNDGWRRLRESQKSLHADLKPEMARLCLVLHLSEEVVGMVEKFLEYVINNHRVFKEPTTTLQAFQISMCWIAASLLKQKINHKESLALAKDHLMFGCSREEVDYIYSVFCCMKSVFLERMRCLKMDSLTKDSEQSNNNCGKNQSDANLSNGILLQENNKKIACSAEVQECAAEWRHIHYGLVKKDIAKAIRDIQKKFSKRVTMLLEKHEEEKEEVERNYAKERSELEERKKVEAAIIRKHMGTQTLLDKLKKLDCEFERKFEVLKSQKDESLKNLEDMHQAARGKLTEKEAHWIERIQNWAQVELLDRFPDRDSNSKRASGMISSNTSENAPDAAEACDSPAGEAISADTDCMVSEESQECFVAVDPLPKARNTEGNGCTQLDVPEMVTSNNCEEERILPVTSSQRHLHNVATESGSNGLAPSAEPETLTAADCQEKVLASNSPSSKDQSCDEVTSTAPDEGVSLRVPAISKPHLNPENAASADLPLNGEQALVGGDNNRASNVVSDSAATLDQQNEEICSLNQESPAEELVLPLVQPASAVESGGATAPDQAVQNTSPPSSPAENQHEPAANIETQNILEAAEPRLVESVARSASGRSNHEAEIAESDAQVEQLTRGDASRGHDLHADSECVHRLSNENVSQNAETSGHRTENHVELANEAVVQPSAGVTEDQPANIQDGGLMANVSVDASLPNNSMAQHAILAAPQIPFPLSSDPFQHELEKIRRDLEKAEEIHEEETSKLKAECESKISLIVAQIRREYESKLRDVDTRFHAKTKELETNKSYVIMNKYLADAFKNKCTDPNASAASAKQRDANSCLVQQLLQQSSQFCPTRPSAFPLRPSVTSMAPPPLASPIVSPVPRASGPPLNSPLYPVTQPRPPPLIANATPSSAPSSGTAPTSHSRARAPAPHLQPFRPSSFPIPTTNPSLVLPRGTPTQHPLQNPPATASSSPVLSQHVQRAPSPAYQNAFYSRMPRPETLEGPSTLPNLPVLESYTGLCNQPRASHKSGLVASTFSSLLLQQQQQQQQQQQLNSANSLQGGRAEVSRNADVVCLSDDE